MKERRVYIIPEKQPVDELIKAAAIANNCPEIAKGIPPRLEGVIDEASLPLVFEEPELSPPEPVRDLATELNDIKTRLAAS